jgi:hypothetical protein
VNRFILEHLSKNGAQTNTRWQEENSVAPSGGRSHACVKIPSIRNPLQAVQQLGERE